MIGKKIRCGSEDFTNLLIIHQLFIGFHQQIVISNQNKMAEL